MKRLEPFFRLFLGLGGLIDALAGPLLVFAPELVANVVGVPVPADLYYVRLIGVMAFSLGLLFLLGASDPGRYFGIVMVAAVLRAGAAALLGVSLATQDLPPSFVGFMWVEGPVAVVHVIYAWWLCYETQHSEASPPLIVTTTFPRA